MSIHCLVKLNYYYFYSSLGTLPVVVNRPPHVFIIPHVSVCVSSLGEWEGGDKKAQVTEAWQ